jgi:hypothetical protein
MTGTQAEALSAAHWAAHFADTGVFQMPAGL